MKTLLVTTLLLGFLATDAFNPPPSNEGTGEGDAQQQSVIQADAVTRLATLPLPLPQARGIEQPDEPASVATFATITITVDPKGVPLGAYQVELTSPDASFRVIGVEAGEHPAFDHGRPPYFDPVAQQGDADRLILAEYARPRLEADALPNAPVVVATISVLFEGGALVDEQPPLQLQLMTAGDADGNKINADARYTLTIPERPE